MVNIVLALWYHLVTRLHGDHLRTCCRRLDDNIGQRSAGSHGCARQCGVHRLHRAPFKLLRLLQTLRSLPA